MFYSHEFARPETLLRASYWLKHWGIDSFRMVVDPRCHRITCQLLSLGEIAEVETIIKSLESAERATHSKLDPRPWEIGAGMPDTSPEPQSTPISWHRDADRMPTEPGLEAVYEAIRRAS